MTIRLLPSDHYRLLWLAEKVASAQAKAPLIVADAKRRAEEQIREAEAAKNACLDELAARYGFDAARPITLDDATGELQQDVT